MMHLCLPADWHGISTDLQLALIWHNLVLGDEGRNWETCFVFYIGDFVINFSFLHNIPCLGWGLKFGLVQFL